VILNSCARCVVGLQSVPVYPAVLLSTPSLLLTFCYRPLL
jgi:hypothetical protein